MSDFGKKSTLEIAHISPIKAPFRSRIPLVNSHRARAHASGSAVPWALACILAIALVIVLLGDRRLLRTETSRVGSAPVVTAIEKIARLSTIEVRISDVVRYEEVKSFLFLDFPKSATLRIRGAVVGGFDLQRDGVKIAARPGERVVKIELPRPRILSIDPSLEWFDERSGIFNPITPQDRNRWFLWAKASLARAARDAGLDEKAKEHAVELLSGASEAFGWKAQVAFADGPLAGAPPASGKL